MNMVQGNTRSWMAVFVLGIGAFTVVTTELAPIGMLSNIAQDLAQTASWTGLIVTAYAWIGALAALLAVVTLSGLPRRPLLLGLMTILGLSNLLAAQSSTFTVLIVARMIGALAHGAFWAMVGTMGAQLVPKEQVGRATAVIFGGVSIASVVGVPLVNLLANHAGWRAAFGCLGSLSLATGLTLAVLLPKIPGTAPIGIDRLQSVIANTRLRQLYVIAAVTIVAHFAAFTYIETLLSSRLHLSVAWVAVCLFAFGVAGIAGNLLCGAFIDSHLRRMLTFALLAMALSLVITGTDSTRGPLIALLVVIGWGAGVATLFVGIQAWVIRLAGELALPASAIYAAIFNAAVGTGALVGASVLDSWGVGTLCIGAAALMLASSAMVARYSDPQRQPVVIESFK